MLRFPALLVVAVVLAWASPAARAADMPGSGSKNFTPPSSVPSYFSHEQPGGAGHAASSAEPAAPASSEPPPVAAAPHHTQTAAAHAHGKAKAHGKYRRFAKAKSGRPKTVGRKATKHTRLAALHRGGRHPAARHGSTRTAHHAAKGRAKPNSTKHASTGKAHGKATAKRGAVKHKAAKKKKSAAAG